MGELLLADYTRRGFFDGVGIRLPTHLRAAGQAQQGGLGLLLQHHPRAARRQGGGAAGRARRCCTLAREPARGGRLPASTRRPCDATRSAPARQPDMPGVCCTVGRADRGAAPDRRRQGGARCIRREPDPTIVRIVAGWPARFDASRARASSASSPTPFDAIIRIHIDEDRGGRISSPEQRHATRRSSSAKERSRERMRALPPQCNGQR